MSEPDDTDAVVPVAATVVLARDGADGPEVLVMERPDRGSFAGAWVFPGGKLEPADAAPDASEEDDARRAGVRETAEETGLIVDAAAAVTLSCWNPPADLALRIRTWFFVAPAPGGMLALSPDEAVAAQWARPADLIAAHGRGEVMLYPPTWVTLHGLRPFDDVASLIGALRMAGPRRFDTIARRGASGPMLMWQDDADYAPGPASAPGDEPLGRHRLEIGDLPWRYERTT